MDFNKHYGIKKTFEGEVGFEVSVTEQTGWLPVSRQVERLLRAGERLQTWRQNAYEFEDGVEIPTDYVDPTRSPGFDMADASELSQRLVEKKQQMVDRQNASKSDTINETELEAKNDDEKGSEETGVGVRDVDESAKRLG